MLVFYWLSYKVIRRNCSVMTTRAWQACLLRGNGGGLRLCHLCEALLIDVQLCQRLRFRSVWLAVQLYIHWPPSVTASMSTALPPFVLPSCSTAAKMDVWNKEGVREIRAYVPFGRCF